MSRSFYCSLFLLLQALTSLSGARAESDALLSYTFDADKNLLGDWALPAELLGKLNNEITLESSDEGLLLKTGNNNIRLTKGEEWENFRAVLTGRIEYPCSFELLGRYHAEPSPCYYFLRIDSSTKQILLGRFRNLKTEILQEVALPGSFKFREFELSLEFDGQDIKGFLDGELLVEHPDDGAIPTGQVGIGGLYHTNLRLKTIEVVPNSQRSPSASGLKMKSSPVHPLASQASPVLQKDETLSLALKNWDISKAYKKKVDCVRVFL